MKSYLPMAILLTLPLTSFGGEESCDKILKNLDQPLVSEQPIKQSQTAKTTPVDQMFEIQEKSINGLIQAYIQRLGFNQDPFAMVASQAQANQIYARLLLKKSNNQWVPSSLAQIDVQLKKVHALGDKVYNVELVNQILKDSALTVQNPNISLEDLQSNLIALRYSHDYLRRFKPQQVVDRDGQKAENQPENKDQQQQPQQKPQGGDEEQKPEYPDLPKEYKPFTKDTAKQASNKENKQTRVIEANFKTAYFGQRYFTDINRSAANPFKESVLPITPQAPGKFQVTSKKMVVNTLGRTEVDLFVPPLHRPLQPSNPNVSITRSETGGYKMQIKGNVSQVEVPIMDEDQVAMNPLYRDLLTRPVGFQTQEWPQKVQTEILHKYTVQDAKNDPLKVSKAVADHLATQYLYSVGERKETDPINALNAGAFQCDMAAFTMASILRDQYQIPTRIVGGFRAKNFQGGKDGMSYLILPGEAHVWVEVYHNNKWNLFDPTPLKKDKKEENPSDAKKDPYQDNVLDDMPKVQDDKNEKSEDDAKADKPSDKKSDDKKQAGKEASDKKQDDKDQKDQAQQMSAEEKAIEKEKLIQQLELGSLELEPTPERNPLLERTMRVLFQSILDPNKRGLDVQNGLNLLSSAMKKFNTPSLKQYYQQALVAHAGDHPDLKNWIDQVLRLMPSQDVNKTYQDILKISQSTDLYIQLMDPTGKVKIPHELSQNLHSILQDLKSLAHPKAAEIALANELMKGLPGVARQMVNKDFDISTIGPNAPTLNLAEKIKSGKMNDLRLLSELSPVSDFILNSTPRPEYIQIRTWTADGNKRRGRDILPLQRYSDMSRAILGQPGKSLEENMREGTAYVLTHKKRVQIPAGHGEDEAERITIVLYDTSGSMSGDPAHFQAGLISAFTAKALSDVSGTGKHRHKVLIVPFDTEPGTPTRVTNSLEAQEVLRNYQSKLKNTGGGTDIQKAMIQAMALIADAEKRNGEPLAAANIVMMTDGQADINPAELMKARQSINRTTPLQTMFIAINQTNEELMKFAMESKKMGAEQGFYREYGPEAITDYLKKARTLDLKALDEKFYSDAEAKQIPSRTFQKMEEAYRQAMTFAGDLAAERYITTPRQHLENFEKVPWRDGHNNGRPLENWIVKLRSFTLGQIFQDKKLLEKVADDIMKNFETITGVKFNDLSGYEQEQIRHFLKYAAGMESGV